MKKTCNSFLFRYSVSALNKIPHISFKACITPFMPSKKSRCFLLLVCCFFYAKTQTWVNVGNPGFTAGSTFYSAQAFDGTVPYVVYQDIANSSKVSVMKYDGISWVYVGTPGFSAGSAGYTSIAIYNGNPYVAFEDMANGRKITVMLYDGSNWVMVGSPGFSLGQVIPGFSIAFNNGTPYVAFAAFPSGNASVMKYDGTNWVYTGATEISSGGASYPSIDFYGNTPYLAYMDGGASYKATVKMYNGTSWVNVGSRGFSAGTAQFTRLGINNTGVLFIAFQDGANAEKLTVMQFDGTNWVIAGTAGVSSGVTFQFGLAFKAGNPVVVFRDLANGNKASVLQFNGTNWVNIGAPGFSAHTVQFPGISVIGSTYYVSYRDGAAGDRITMMSYTNAVLPLRLLSFNALKKDLHQIELRWQVADEINVAGYEIQSSADGVKFSKVGFSVSKNSSSTENYYHTLTQNNSSAYYRLKVIDNDGQFMYSNIITLHNAANKNAVILYPNPVSHTLYIEHYGLPKNAVLQIADADGKIILQQAYGTAIQKLIDVTALPTGIYTVMIVDNKKIISLEKIVKK